MTSTLVHDLASWVDDEPDAVAVRSATEVLSVKGLVDRVSQVAATLRKAGVKSGELVAISADGIDEVVNLIAVQAVGAVSVVTPSEAEFRDSSATRLLHSGRSWAGTGAVDSRIDAARGWTGWTTDTNSAPELVVHACLTSGTTGRPKLVEMTRETTERRTDGYIAMWPVREAATLFRLSSIAGFVALNAAIRAREPFVVIAALDADSLELLSSNEVNALCGAPNQIAQVVHEARSGGIDLTFSAIVTAGAPQTPQFVSAAKSVCSGMIANVYGSTEAGTAAWSTEEAATAFHGTPVLDTEFQVIDADGCPVSWAIEGEIRYRNPGLCATYVVDGVREPIAGDGWFYPGDTGRIEEDGTILITGRTTEIVNVAGVKVNPLDVEAAVESIPAVRDAACTTVTLSDGLTHLVLAVVVPDRETYDEVVALLETRDPAGRPNIVVAVPTIPRNRNGKIDRAALAEKLGLAIRVTAAGADG